jgi:hypothetical protein
MEIFLSIAALAIGSFITWNVSRIYYEKASLELKKEAQDLQKLNGFILEAMEIAGLVHVNRDSEGKPTGFNLTIKVADAISFHKAKPQ